MKKIILLLLIIVLSVKLSYSQKTDTLFITLKNNPIDLLTFYNDSEKVVYTYSSIPNSKFSIENINKNQNKLTYFHNNITGSHIIFFAIKKANKIDKYSKVIIVQNTTQLLWIILAIIGGLGLFLFGINYMSNSFIKFNEYKIGQIIQSISNNTKKSVLAGIFLTTMLQSSSAVSIFLMRLIDNRLTSLSQTFGIIIGGALGTTVILQIIALRLNEYALILIAIGFILAYFTKKKNLKLSGEIITGLGLLYLGLLIMSENASKIKSFETVINFLSHLSNPYIGILIGILFTTLTQSASAFIGILMMLGSNNMISLETAISLLIGSNIGTSLPVIIDSKNRTIEAKNAAYFHLYYRLIVALIFIFWITDYSSLVIYASNLISSNKNVSMPHLIANAHTLMYLSVTIAIMPFASKLYNYFSKLIKTDTTNDPYKPKYINEKSLESPNIAILLSKKETLHLANLVKKMLENLLPIFLNKDSKLIAEIEQTEKIVNSLRDDITIFLVKLNKKDNQPETVKEIYKLLAIIKELEEIADIVNTNLIPKAKFWSNSNLEFSDEGKKELESFHNHCVNHYISVLELMVSYDLQSVKKLKKSEKKTIKIAYKLEKSHFTRLIEENELSFKSSKTHIELIGLMQAITRHATLIVRILYDFE